jgi:hypothetical protein
MKRLRPVIMILMVAALLAPLVWPESASARRERPRHDPALEALQDALDHLDGALATLKHAKNFKDRARVMRDLDRSRARLIDAMNAGGLAGPRVVQPEPPRPMPLDQMRFGELLASLNGLSFSAEQLRYLEDASRHAFFLTEQVRQVMAVFSFGKDKVKAAAMLYPKVLDHHDFHRVLTDLTFESEREDLRREIRKFESTGTPVKAD